MTLRFPPTTTSLSSSLHLTDPNDGDGPSASPSLTDDQSSAPPNTTNIESSTVTTTIVASSIPTSSSLIIQPPFKLSPGIPLSTPSLRPSEKVTQVDHLTSERASTTRSVSNSASEQSFSPSSPASTSLDPNPSVASGNDSMNGATILAAVLGATLGIAVLAVSIFALIVVLRRRRRSNSESISQSHKLDRASPPLGVQALQLTGNTRHHFTNVSLWPRFAWNRSEDPGSGTSLTPLEPQDRNMMAQRQAHRTTNPSCSGSDVTLVHGDSVHSNSSLSVQLSNPDSEKTVVDAVRLR